MTNQEAIQWIRDRMQEGRYNPSISNPYQKDDCHIAGDMAIKALTKQTPRKPDAYYDGYANGKPVWEYECPNCGRELDGDEHHCECGQALDWSDND